MENKEFIQFCLERNLLLDKEILEIFKGIDLETKKNLLLCIERNLSSRLINKKTLVENQNQIKNFLANKLKGLDLNELKNFDKLFLELNLSFDELCLNKSQKYNDSNKEEQDSSKNKKESLQEQENKKQEDFNSKEFFKQGKVKLTFLPKYEGKSFGVKDFVNHFKSRYDFLKKALQEHAELNDLISLDKISLDRRNFSVIGIVSDKRITKNNNILFEIEDSTGKIKVLINNNKKELYDKALDIPLDGVIGFKGSGNKEIMFCNDLVFPDSTLPERKLFPKEKEEECAIFIGDLHFGSKKFMKNQFEKFIDYLNTGDKEVRKIKYLFIVGDVVTGVGNYPDQEYDLEIPNLEEQFSQFAGYLSQLRKDIKIIISPGNHDGVRLMEPQPLLNEKYAWPLYNLENVILTTNPARVNIASDKEKGFGGFEVLTYHGFSFPFYANNIWSLIKVDAMNKPETIMKYLLKNRHLAPEHTSTQYVPSEEDGLIIKKIPDIFVSAHTHKSGITYYNNILLISVSTWEEMTPYQEKFGNKPDHCKVPLVNLKTREVKILDFE
ncbi:MAG: metallophosphoesterase [Nanoarchaeota archaeon]